MQPLLKQSPMDQQEEVSEPVNDDQYESAEPEHGGGDESGGDFTINSDEVESAIKEQLDGRQTKALNAILDAGNKLLFSKDTHYDIMQGLTDDDDTQLADELGKGGISLAIVLYEKSGGTMPQELIIPAGVILLARVAEFLKQTGHKINDEIFHDAVMMFQSGLSQQADPEYHNKIKQAMGDQGQPEAQDQSQQPMQPQQPMMQQQSQPMPGV
jgi:hypothetical protein